MSLQNIPFVVVRDSRASLADISARFFDDPSRELKIVGITGTDGKTSTSLLVEAMLARSGKRTGLIGTVSIKIGDETVDHETRQTTPESLEIQRMLRRMVEAEWNGSCSKQLRMGSICTGWTTSTSISAR